MPPAKKSLAPRRKNASAKPDEKKKPRGREREQRLHARKMDAISRLAGVVAHDLNNLLTTILGYSDLLLTALPPEAPAHKDVLHIQRAGRRAADLTNTLLILGRRQVLQARLLDVNAFLRGLEDRLREVAGESVALEIRTSARPGTIHADPEHLQKVVLNLAANAPEAMPDGGKMVIGAGEAYLPEHAGVCQIAVPPGHYTFISVADTGKGMDDETLGQIFEPFFTTKPRGAGLGLGLAIVYGIVRQSGGTVAVRSKPGEGSTFELYFPSANPGASPAAR